MPSTVLSCHMPSCLLLHYYHLPSQGNADIKPHVKRTVELSRPEGKGLGFNIIGGEGDAGIFISYISPGSISDQSEKLTAGDMILEVINAFVYVYICMYVHAVLILRRPITVMNAVCFQRIELCLSYTV